VRGLFVMMAATVALASTTNAMAGSAKRTEISGHFVGESVAAFLQAEPEAQQEATACREHPDRASCARVLGALDRQERAEISTSGSKAFVLDGGKLVRLTMLVEGAADAAVADLMQKFGAPTTQTTIQGQDVLGSKWENHLLAWDTPDASVTLYEDNNPSLPDRRPLLIVESRTNNARGYTISAKELAAVEVGRNVAPAK
jgi:hypothetical protein